jgi:hypothetical protein
MVESSSVIHTGTILNNFILLHGDHLYDDVERWVYSWDPFMKKWLYAYHIDPCIFIHPFQNKNLFLYLRKNKFFKELPPNLPIQITYPLGEKGINITIFSRNIHTFNEGLPVTYVDSNGKKIQYLPNISNI